MKKSNIVLSPVREGRPTRPPMTTTHKGFRQLGSFDMEVERVLQTEEV
jgi:hypothetical protein